MKSNREVLFGCVALILVLHVNLSSCEIIGIEDGSIEGSVLTSRKGRDFQAFRNIPYAEPPVGDLRFKAPVVKAPWLNVLDCTSYGPMCIQQDRWNGNLALAEDCLQLNVFTPQLPSLQNTQLKPVIAFIHGGGFELGSSLEYGPDYLMDREVVLVTINYRLAAFGMLAVETADIPGNAAFKDQTLAFKWIQNNIHHFGGDPSRVTIAGLSAGAHSVTGHMLSPLSEGLFHNVIAVSGGLAWQVRLKTNNFESTRTLAANVDCPTDVVANMVECLTNKPAVDIAENMVLSFFACPIMSWMPVVEPALGQTDRWLHEDPIDLLRSGNFSKVNLMIGITADEFISPIAEILENSSLTAELNENFDNLAPTCFLFEKNEYKSSAEISQILRKSYLPYDVIDARSFTGLSNLIGDGIIGYGIHRFVDLASKHIDVYYYKFSYVGRFSRFLHPRDKPYGVHHVDDIQYIFRSTFMGSDITSTDPESITVERMTRIWEQFALTGNPNNLADEFLVEMNWPKHDAANEFYLDIGTHLIEKHSLFIERYSVWDLLETASSAASVKAAFMIITSMFALLKRAL